MQPILSSVGISLQTLGFIMTAIVAVVGIMLFFKLRKK
jgi:hypothetical protein